jgi:hypothetical protein
LSSRVCNSHWRLIPLVTTPTARSTSTCTCCSQRALARQALDALPRPRHRHHVSAAPNLTIIRPVHTGRRPRLLQANGLLVTRLLRRRPRRHNRISHASHKHAIHCHHKVHKTPRLQFLVRPSASYCSFRLRENGRLQQVPHKTSSGLLISFLLTALHAHNA